jgi:hypothetical protein
VKCRVAEMGVWFIAGFCTGLRGEENLLIEFAGTAKSLKFLGDLECPHFILVISGRTKGVQLAGAKFGIPCAATTEGTHLQPGRWVKRLVTLMKDEGIQGGRLFRRKLSPTKLCEFEHDFYTVLGRVQATTNLIDKEMDVTEDFGLPRSLRRGLTAHARNMGVSAEWIKAMNRWRSELGSQTGAPRLDMPDTYSALEALKPLFLRITRSF